LQELLKILIFDQLYLIKKLKSENLKV